MYGMLLGLSSSTAMHDIPKWNAKLTEETSEKDNEE